MPSILHFSEQGPKGTEESNFQHREIFFPLISSRLKQPLDALRLDYLHNNKQDVLQREALFSAVPVVPPTQLHINCILMHLNGKTIVLTPSGQYLIKMMLQFTCLHLFISILLLPIKHFLSYKYIGEAACHTEGNPLQSFPTNHYALSNC